MRNAGGYAVLTSPDASYVKLDSRGSVPIGVGSGQTELDTFQCSHCGSIKHVMARARPEDIGGLCKQCMGLICSACVDTGRCDPLEKKLERAEKRSIALRSYGI